jgi:uncharacterized phiE125 gp8 family phage protein
MSDGSGSLWPGPLLDLVQTAPPVVAPLDLDTVKLHLRVDYDDQDSLIQAFIDAAIESLDGYAGFLGRCLVEQQWTLYLDRFPHHGWDYPLWREGRRELMLPLSPLIAVDSVTYIDPAGDAQTLDPATYVVRTGPRASIALRMGQSWPLTSRDPRNVAIAFRAGYATVANGSGEPPVPNPSDVPSSIRSAMLLMIGDLFENRLAVEVNESRVTQILNPTADRLLARYQASWL